MWLAWAVTVLAGVAATNDVFPLDAGDAETPAGHHLLRHTSRHHRVGIHGPTLVLYSPGRGLRGAVVSDVTQESHGFEIESPIGRSAHRQPSCLSFP